ncbi:alpha/beta hydrolase family protein [Actinocrispum wychmicini]|uniref:alpha/beta hydrolase family protein n=1 Tax=Actinocrispum wychmicini TaxID=1213861 RepID=UPI001053CF8B|nr:lipase [Actinocrispum wychmicini]
MKTLFMAGVVGASLVVAAPTANAAAVSFTLPSPTGQFPVGTTSLHLVDSGRADPWKPDRRRELMVSLWYPARDTARFPLAHWTTPGVVPYLENLGLGIPKGTVDWTSPLTAAHVDAPADGRRPVVLYSPGYGGPRFTATAQAQDLASHGYVVVTIDPTFETAVEFPGGRVEQPEPQDGSPETTKKALDARVADARFVLDALCRRTPDADGRPLPRGLNLDLGRVGMFGHSFGGFTTGETMYRDRRIAAGMNLDGGMQTSTDPYIPGEVTKHGLNRPFLLMGNSTNNHSHTNPAFDRSWADFWAVQRGWKRDVQLPGSAHYSFTDVQVILPQLAAQLGIPVSTWAQVIGTGDPATALRTQNATIRAFFDRFILAAAPTFQANDGSPHPVP